MTTQYSISTKLSAKEVTSAINENLGKKSLWEFIKSVQFEGKVENNQIKIDTIQIPYARVRGTINEELGKTILNLEIHTDETEKSTNLFLKAVIIVLICLGSLLTIINWPTSIFSYFLILVYSILGFVIYKVTKFWLKYVEDFGDFDPKYLADVIKKMVKGNYV